LIDSSFLSSVTEVANHHVSLSSGPEVEASIDFLVQADARNNLLILGIVVGKDELLRALERRARKSALLSLNFSRDRVVTAWGRSVFLSDFPGGSLLEVMNFLFVHAGTVSLNLAGGVLGVGSLRSIPLLLVREVDVGVLPADGN
jgi:hypothetical protein